MIKLHKASTGPTRIAIKGVVWHPSAPDRIVQSILDNVSISSVEIESITLTQTNRHEYKNVKESGE